MGARSNKTLKPKKVAPKMSAAALKKFKKKPCSFCQQKVSYIDYKDIATLRKFISDRGKIRSGRDRYRSFGRSIDQRLRSYTYIG